MRISSAICAALIFLTLTACTSSGGGGSSSTATATNSGTQCSDTLPVCVGDPIRDMTGNNSRDYKVTELVASGQLSRDEKATVAKAAPENRQDIYDTYQMIATKTGVRVFARAAGDTSDSSFSGDSLGSTFRLNRCAPAGQPCAGDTSYGFENEVYVKQQLLGSALVTTGDYAWDFLVRETLPDGTTHDQLKLTLNPPLYTTGCTTLQDSTHKFCVGEVYFAQKAKQTIVAVSKDGPEASLAVVDDKGKYTHWTHLNDYGIFPYAMSACCIPGANDLCMPAAAGFQFLKVRLDEYLNVKESSALTLEGIGLKEDRITGNGAEFIDTTGTEVNLAAADITALFRAQGCTADGKLCIGKTYLAPINSPGDFRIVGWNPASNLVIGTSSNEASGVLVTMRPDQVGALKAP